MKQQNDGLKTLKDLEMYQGDQWANDFWTVSLEDLKQIAIEQYKIHENLWIVKENRERAEAIMAFTKYLFNLTEEDLKEVKK